MRGPHWKSRFPVQCRRLATSASVQHVAVLPSDTLEVFRDAFNAGKPVMLPRAALNSLPSIRKWFSASQTDLARSYLAKYGSVLVPLEFSDGKSFTRMQQPLSYFLESMAASTAHQDHTPRRYFSAHVPGLHRVRRVQQANTFFTTTIASQASRTQIYLAQAPISDLPRALRDDLPTPDLILKVGKGDVYDSSIWIGLPPTYTPLHRDPNPNLFVQLAGIKMIRLFKPDIGRGILTKVQEAIGGSSGQAIRGEEMMQGAERAALEEEVWGDESESLSMAHEAELQSGDALFIPKGWWHSVKSVGDDINGSANWWFR